MGPADRRPRLAGSNDLEAQATERGSAEMVAPGAAPKRGEGVTVAGALWA
jgi:hypothetical protein